VEEENLLAQERLQQENLLNDEAKLESLEIDNIGEAAKSEIVDDENEHSEVIDSPVSKPVDDTWKPKPLPNVQMEPLVITKSNLHDYLGKPLFTNDRLYDQTPVGTTMGLAYTSMGGTTLYVESTAINYDQGKGGTIKFTGRLGETMSESGQIAFSVARAFMTKHFPENTFFQDHHVHLSVIEAATPKDGPSAGVTIITSLLSLALNQPVLQNFGLTGEVSLTGKVLKIGGVREKCIAAKRSGCEILSFPKDNQKDFEELPQYVKEGLTVHFVDHYNEVFDIALNYENQMCLTK